MLDYAPRDPRQLVRLPSEYILVRAQELDQGLLLLGLEVGAYGESGVGGPVLIDGYLLGFCLVLGEQLFLLGGCSPLGLGGLRVGGLCRRRRLEGELEHSQRVSGVPVHGEDAAAPGHLHEVVRRVCRGHELGQRWIAEDGIVGEADGGDVEVDQLRAEVVVSAEGYWEPDLSQGAG